MWPVRVPPGHFLVDDPAPRRHPLDIPGGDNALVSHTVPMFHISPENISDCLNAPMRMPGKTLHKVLRIVGPEVIQQQKRVKHRHLAESKHPFEVNPGTLNGGLAFPNLTDLLV